MNVKPKMVWGFLQFIDIHDFHKHQHALSLRLTVTVVQCRKIHESPGCNQGNDFVHVNRRQFSLEQTFADGLEVHVPMVA